MKTKRRILAFLVIVCLLPFCFAACDSTAATTSTIDLQSSINLATRSCVTVESTGAAEGINGSAGSGVIYRIDGRDLYIITNWHVICWQLGENVAKPAPTIRIAAGNAMSWAGNEGAESFQTMPEYWLSATLLGGSVKEDIAILKATVSANNDYITRFALVPAKADVNNRAWYGETVFAVGNSIGLGLAASEGVVSSVAGSEYCLGSDLTNVNQHGILRRLVRTTAAVQQGNSGGGLFNAKAELIGIVQSKVSYYGYEDGELSWTGLPADNVGFAVPVSLAGRIADQIIARHLANRIDTSASLDNLIVKDLGVKYKNTNMTLAVDEMGRNCYLEDVTVTNMVDNPFGLIKDDVIVAVKYGDTRTKILNAEVLRDLMIELWDQTAITIEIRRNNTNQTLVGNFAA